MLGTLFSLIELLSRSRSSNIEVSPPCWLELASYTTLDEGRSTFMRENLSPSVVDVVAMSTSLGFPRQIAMLTSTIATDFFL